MKMNNRLSSDNTGAEPKSNLWQKIMKFTRDVIARLNILDRISLLVERISRFLSSGEGTLFIFFIIPISLSVAGLIWNNARLLSIAAIVWMGIWLAFFSVSIWVSNNLEEFSKWIKAGAVVSEALEKNWLANAAHWLMKKMSEFSFTFAGVAISIGFISTQLHILFLRDFASGFFSNNLVGWGLFGLLPIIIGRISDMARKLNKAKQTGKSVILLGVLQFYISFVVLITTAIGGVTAFRAIYQIKRKPWEIIVHDILSVSYSESFSYAIREGMGSFFFLLFYFFIPVYLLWLSWISIKSFRTGNDSKYSKNTFYWLITVNIPLILMALIVSWNEGWIEAVFSFFIVAIAWLVLQLTNLYHWVADFFI